MLQEFPKRKPYSWDKQNPFAVIGFYGEHRPHFLRYKSTNKIRALHRSKEMDDLFPKWLSSLHAGEKNNRKESNV